MKNIFRKAMTIAANVALIGTSIASAAAASYPSPFTSNTAIVVGASAAPSDNIAASSIASDLNALNAGSAVTTVEGGEEFMLYKDNDKLHFGDAMSSIYASLDDGEMDALADGEYKSGDIETDYEQSITLGTVSLSLIANDELNDEEPTIGYDFDDGVKVLSYTMTFDNPVAVAEMPETDFPLFGREYYVLDAAADEVTLLNSAEKTVVSEGESVVVDGHTVSIEYITSTQVKFNVDGESTDKLSDGDYYELDDEYYIVLSENLYTDKDGTSSKAEFSLGSGKVVLENTQEVEVNGESVSDFDVTMTENNTHITSITLTWNVEDETFLTEGDSIEMPVFGAYSLVFGGVDFGDETETITVNAGDTLTLSMGNYDVDLLHNESGTMNVGDEDASIVTIAEAAAASKLFAIGEGERILATLLDSDLADVETAYYEVVSVSNDTTTFDLKLNDLIGDDDVEFADADAGDSEDLTDSISVEVVAVYDSGSTVPAAINGTYNDVNGTGYVDASDATALMDFAVLNVSSTSSLYWDTVVSEEGVVIEIPVSSTDTIDFYETADDGDIETTLGSGTVDFKLDLGWDSSDKLYATVDSGIDMVDETDDDKEVGYDAGIHATKVMEDTDAHTLEIEYYVNEVSVELSIVAGGEVSTSSEAGVMTVTDANVASVAGKNLIVVGGSAINSVAAELLGGAYREAAFTAATGVAAGEFLIQSFDRSGKTALVVAGYNAADTEKAVEYLLNNDVNTAVGTKMKGTSATEATVVTA